jgi:hypothetical protein
MNKTNENRVAGGEMDDFIRPFLVTSGRTRSSVEGLRLETMVQITEHEQSPLRFEAARVFALCKTSIAIAEISSYLNLPIGTVKVIVGDLITSGHLEQFSTITHDPTDGTPADVALISRLIDGVRRL